MASYLISLFMHLTISSYFCVNLLLRIQLCLIAFAKEYTKHIKYILLQLYSRKCNTTPPVSWRAFSPDNFEHGWNGYTLHVHGGADAVCLIRCSLVNLWIISDLGNITFCRLILYHYTLYLFVMRVYFIEKSKTSLLTFFFTLNPLLHRPNQFKYFNLKNQR